MLLKYAIKPQTLPAKEYKMEITVCDKYHVLVSEAEWWCCLFLSFVVISGRILV